VLTFRAHAPDAASDATAIAAMRTITPRPTLALFFRIDIC